MRRRLVSCSLAVSAAMAATFVAAPTANEASMAPPGLAVELPPSVGHERAAMVLVGTALIGVAALVRRRV
jgi:hypothetical protein